MAIRVPMQTYPVPITKEWVEERGAYWQELLRLKDWEIVYKILPKKDMNGNFGQNNAVTNRKFAHIYLLDQDSPIEVGDITRYDPEVTLVHELLHCHINTLDVKSALHRNYEYVIESLSVALVTLRRGGRNPELFIRTLTSPREMDEAEKRESKD